jgi:hypothetical protein
MQTKQTRGFGRGGKAYCRLESFKEHTDISFIAQQPTFRAIVALLRLHIIVAAMSKPISISFGKPKTSLSGTNTPAPPTHKPRATLQAASTKPKLLGHDSDDDDEPKQPLHEAVTGFTANGAILGERVPEKELAVIKNPGNSDWRKRRRAGRDPLPHEVQTPMRNTAVVEKDEVSKASGLQFAEKDVRTATADSESTGEINANGANPQGPAQDRTEDEIALQALLQDGERRPNSNAVIVQKANANRVRAEPIDELGDYRADVASRPDSATLEDYAAMPVEEFGLALIRGMGTKRKADGQMADPAPVNSATPKIREPRPGYLGIGAKAAPGAEVELGAWGKTAMRKGMNSKAGDGLYTPVMLKDKRTGEMLTEEELQARKKEAKDRLNGKEEDWKERRDKNLERRGREGNGEQKRLMDKDDDYRNQMNDFSRNRASHRDERNGSSRSDRSRSRDRRRRDGDDRDEKYRDRSRDRDRERRRDKYRDDDRYDSSSSRKNNLRDGERGGYDKKDDRRRKERY